MTGRSLRQAKNKSVSLRKRIANIDPNALNKAIAMDIGKEMVAYLEVMYPDVFHAMNSGCELSIRNHIHNDIIAALEVKGTQAHLDRIAERTEFRRGWLKTYRDYRKREHTKAAVAAPSNKAGEG